MTEATEEKTVPTLPSRAELAASGLTKRNQEFMHQVVELVTETSQAALVAEVQTQLLAGQKTGQTAKQIFGSPAQALGLVKKVASEDNSELTPNQIYAAHPLWQLIVDNALAFGMLFMVMFGFMLMFSNVSRESAGAAGLVSLIGTAVFGGLFFSIVTKIMAAKEGSKLVKFGGAILLFLLWFGIYLGLAALPAIINPILPGWVYLVLAVITFFGFRYWRVRTKLVGGFMGGARRPVKR
ncbi:putative membrane protein [Weissella oryzae SG25]|uniref:Putative membrane protein n=1 Tax=Weissella oryzae (strain DSM 25784 / JCM 18191 / LMG 30913 / SG25) TaxID=1329250 RepID=A0A069CRQ0_WEIOS|nr:DUF1129 family protein [Weissella oryzae]GAK30079.1 putative membrane protein [Weissella oryzae SG25]